MLTLVNQVRAQAGVPALCYNVKLNTASQQQSDSGVYGHTWKYIFATGYQWSFLGGCDAGVWKQALAGSDSFWRKLL